MRVSVALCALWCAAQARAGAPTELEGQVMELRRSLEAQAQRLDAQSRALEEQARTIAEQRSLLDAQQAQLAALQEHAQPALALASLTGMGPSERSVSEPVGVAPASEGPPQVPVLADRGGVLTPRGVLTLEPELEIGVSSAQQFEFSGVEIIENAFLIGEIDAAATERQILLSSLNARLGVSDRFEVSLQVPYLRRSDRFERSVVSSSSPERFARRTEANGIGDIELGLHYQFQRTSARLPFMIGNLRLKADTGTSPFEVNRDEAGIETELATGSGYWSLEPSLTFIYPSDPAVLYGSLSYAWNAPVSVDRTQNIAGSQVQIGKVDAGDSIGLGFGVGIGLNETASLNLGYSHRYVTRTRTELNDSSFQSQPLHIGELQLGLAFSAWGRPLQITTSIGVTDEAPDVRVGVRMPIGWRLFD